MKQGGTPADGNRQKQVALTSPELFVKPCWTNWPMAAIRWRMSENTDYDGAWKEALEGYLRPFLELCFPAVAEEIDWEAGITFLDKELQEVVRDADLGKQRVDKLVRVRREDGEEEWVLLHIEVQAQPDDELPLRLYQYHHRLVDRYGQRCATLVIFADEEEGWHPRRFVSELWGCRIAFEFPTCKLVELAGRVDLQTSPNVAAVVIAAHLAAQRARGDVEARMEWKWTLTRRLYELGLEKRDVQELFRLIDWLIRLPDEKEVEFRQKVTEYEEQNAMPHITSIERLSRQEGRREGRQEALQEAVLETLEVRFGTVPDGLREVVETVSDIDHLGRLFRHAIVCADMEKFTRAL